MQTEQAKQLIDNQLEQLSEALAAGKSDQLKAFLATIARFHRYSLGNTLLIMCQRPDATQVAGFHKWKELGRTVKKGEKGIAILAPMLLKNQGRDEDGDQAQQHPRENDSDEERVLRFRVVYVFDISQTEGEELPEFARPQGDPGVYLDRLKSLVSDMDIELEYQEDLSGADGYSTGGLIALRAGLPPAEEFSTLVHELTHECLHHGEKREGTTKQSRELEAESVAFVVSQAVGIDSGTASSDYIQLYRGTKEALAQSLDAIRATSARILEALFKDHSKEKVEARKPSSTPKERNDVAAATAPAKQPAAVKPKQSTKPEQASLFDI